MRVGPGLLVGVIAICALASSSLAQPFRGAPAPEHSGTTNMPVVAPGDPEVMEAEHKTSSAAAPTIALERPIDPDAYICGPGDVFELNFWGRQNFRIKIAADLEGRTFVSKVGYVDVAGKTLTAVRELVSKRVRANYPGLRFDLTLVAPRTFLVHVIGNVKQPGSFTAQPTERIASVLARAGAVPGATRRAIEIRRSTHTTVTADLVRYELSGDTAHNPFVLDGDVIRVPFADTVVSIDGAVRRPGTYELVQTRDLAELLDLAGGLTSAALTSQPIQLIRRNAQQQAVMQEVSFAAGGQLPATAMKDDDRVVIRGAQDVERTVLLLGAVTGAESLDAAATSRRLPYVEGDTVMSVIHRAGGIRAPGDLSRSYISRPKHGGGLEMIAVDLDALIVRREFAADRSIQLGDTLVVPPMRHSIRVEGAVTRAGLYTYNPQFGIAEYVALAGGRTRTARDLGEARLIDASGTSRGYTSARPLSPGDSILVPERNFTRPEIVQIVIATAGLVLSGVAITIAATR